MKITPYRIDYKLINE